MGGNIMSYAKNLGRKVRRSKKKQAEEKPLRRWDQKRLERDEAERPKEEEHAALD